MVKRDYARIGETVFEETLENGLRVFVFPKPEFGKYYAFFATRYGGMDTRFQKNGQWLDTPMGIAHYLEHKMFDTPDGGNALQTLSSTGASPNAFTSTAITGYHFECADQFWDNLRTLLEFVSVPYFTKEVWTKSKGSLGRKSACWKSAWVAGLSFAAGSSVPVSPGAKFCGWFRGIHR